MDRKRGPPAKRHYNGVSLVGLFYVLSIKWMYENRTNPSWPIISPSVQRSFNRRFAHKPIVAYSYMLPWELCSRVSCTLYIFPKFRLLIRYFSSSNLMNIYNPYFIVIWHATFYFWKSILYDQILPMRQGVFKANKQAKSLGKDTYAQAFSLECVPKNIFSYFSTKTYVVGTKKNRLNETVLLSTQNIG